MEHSIFGTVKMVLTAFVHSGAVHLRRPRQGGSRFSTVSDTGVISKIEKNEQPLTQAKVFRTFANKRQNRQQKMNFYFPFEKPSDVLLKFNCLFQFKNKILYFRVTALMF